jgi:cytochrome c oxidase cbb3-type subunit 1
MIPYLLMAFLYALVAVLMAAAVSLSSLNLLPWFNGLTWLRVHFITLGFLTQLLFGGLPLLTAKRYGQPQPDTRWDIWVTLNGGLILLLIGIPLVSALPIIAGGTLVFIAAGLLTGQLVNLRPTAGKPTPHSAGRKFYIAGLVYFLVGIVVGTGLFTGWAEPLGIVGNAKEVHIHANNWGLMSLVFAGLLADLYPVWAKRPLAYPRTLPFIFWAMTLGAFGLIFGPWFQAQWLLVPGLVLHLAATIGLLINVVVPLRGDRQAQTIGMGHLITAYFWLLAPILMAPFVLFGIGELPAAAIEGAAPQALVYGWLLQFGTAVVPYFFQRYLLGDEHAALGGTRLSFVLINLGGIFLWAGIFIEPVRGALYGLAYLLWAAALLPMAVDLWRKTQTGMASREAAL